VRPYRPDRKRRVANVILDRVLATADLNEVAANDGPAVPSRVRNPEVAHEVHHRILRGRVRLREISAGKLEVKADQRQPYVVRVTQDRDDLIRNRVARTHLNQVTVVGLSFHAEADVRGHRSRADKHDSQTQDQCLFHNRFSPEQYRPIFFRSRHAILHNYQL